MGLSYVVSTMNIGKSLTMYGTTDWILENALNPTTLKRFEDIDTHTG